MDLGVSQPHGLVDIIWWRLPVREVKAKLATVATERERHTCLLTVLLATHATLGQ
jgi:hypothetical protein